MPRNAVRPRGHRSQQNRGSARLTFRCETCKKDEPQVFPCRIGVVWSTFETNQDLSVTGWATTIDDKSKFVVKDKKGAEHTLVVCYDKAMETEELRSALPRLLMVWRWKTFGPRTLLSKLANSATVKFRLEDQKHWFNDSRDTFLLEPDRVVPVQDTKGTMRNITRPEALPKNKIDAFYAWQYFLNDLCQQLFDIPKMFGETGEYELSYDTNWFFEPVQHRPEPVGPDIEHQAWDWSSDAIPSRGYEDHYKEYQDQQQQSGTPGREGEIWRTRHTM